MCYTFRTRNTNGETFTRSAFGATRAAAWRKIAAMYPNESIFRG